MDEATASAAGRVAASSVFLAGLDLGKILGSLAGGLGAGTIGLRGTFLAAAASFPAVYFVLAALVRRRSRPLHSEHGSARAAVETH